MFATERCSVTDKDFPGARRHRLSDMSNLSELLMQKLVVAVDSSITEISS
jgi:hypothetical protein